MKTYIKKFAAGIFAALMLLLSTPLFSTSVYADEDTEAGQSQTETNPAETSVIVDIVTNTPPQVTKPISTTSEERSESVATTSDLESTPATTSDAQATTTETAIIATTTSIVTGDALAAANILNVVNTTSVNSQGEIIFAQLHNNQTNALDFRPQSSTSVPCDLHTCLSSDAVSVGVINGATIDNTIFLESITGNNELETNLGNALIETGDAFTGLNLVTIANSTFIDSHYLVVTVNAFRDVTGDIIFPGLNNFFTSAVSTVPTNIDIQNQALVTSNIESNSNTGNNTVDGNVTTTLTGNAKSVTQTINSINSALLGGDSMVIMLKVHGDWLGEIQGLIPEIEVIKGDDGSYYLTNSNQGSTAAAQRTVSATNTAAITTNATLTANSGQNTITGADSSLITTGDALIGANVVTVANATVIGRNWTLAIINIFGDFTGNLAFGRPDLWIGEEISTPATIKNDSVVTYTYTIINQGDAIANNVIVRDDFDTAHLSIIDSSHTYTTLSDGTISFNLPEPLAVGESSQISYQAKVRNTVPGTEITNTVNVTSHENDNNTQDNSDTGTIYASKKVSSGGSNTSKKNTVLKNLSDTPAMTNLSNITINRLSTSSITHQGEVSPQHIIINNPTSKTFMNISLTDNLRDELGNIIQTEVWDIGTLLPYEEITVLYEITFMGGANPGTYTLDTTLLQNNVASRQNLAHGTILYRATNLPTALTYPLLMQSNASFLTDDTLPTVLGVATTTETIIDSLPTILGTNIAQADDGTQDTPVTNTFRQRLLIPLIFISVLLAFTYYRRPKWAL
ncbi:DUF11 domain-containing protein [Patescibacteria group bacterium]|nr:DUF11 domain-containing protein [Patescibacteria group bacterium]